jgi:hypothetical protein
MLRSLRLEPRRPRQVSSSSARIARARATRSVGFAIRLGTEAGDRLTGGPPRAFRCVDCSAPPRNGSRFSDAPIWAAAASMERGRPEGAEGCVRSPAAGFRKARSMAINSRARVKTRPISPARTPTLAPYRGRNVRRKAKKTAKGMPADGAVAPYSPATISAHLALGGAIQPTRLCVTKKGVCRRGRAGEAGSPVVRRVIIIVTSFAAGHKLDKPMAAPCRAFCRPPSMDYARPPSGGQNDAFTLSERPARRYSFPLVATQYGDRRLR